MRTAFALALSAFAVLAHAQERIVAAPFSAQAAGAPLPAGWSELTFRSVATHTRYDLVRDGQATVLRARSLAAASGLIHRFPEPGLDLRRTPILRWRWKISGLIAKADIATRAGDDYPARVYVTFQYDPARAGVAMRMQYGLARSLHGEYPPHAALNYVWDGKAAAGTMVPNAFSERAMMVVAESGAARVGQWVDVERNVYEDYRRAFGEEPPPVSGIAVMTDTDQTGESAEAYYGDIELRPAR